MTELACPHCGHKGEHGIHARNGAKMRYRCRKGCGRTFNAHAAAPEKEAVTVTGSRWVITSAVSGSPAHTGFLRSLERYCGETGARLMVVPIRYRNPTSNLEDPEEWFDPKLTGHLFRERAQLCDGLMLMADVPTQPTAVRPLSGLQTMSGQSSAVFGHPKIALEAVATRMGKNAKLVMTTGAVTQPVYSDSKAGKKGEFHHVLGAVIIEWDGRQFHARHVNANADGGFYDLGRKYGTGTGLASIKALTCGDLHAVRADPEVMQATFFSPDSITATLKPAKIILHDALDFQSASHHNTFFERFRLHQGGRANVARELKETCALIDRIAEAAPWAELVIVDSNHNNHFERWLQDAGNAHDPENALIYHETKAAMLKALHDGKDLDPFAYWGDKMLKHKRRVRFLGAGESLLIDGVEYGQHGDKGPNGARGSIASFTRVGAKVTVGHSHTPGIMDGVYQVGTSSMMDMGYNKGFSSWLHTHCLHYRNGKRTLVSVINGKWRFEQADAQEGEEA